MEGGEVKVCARGWDGQLNLDVVNIRERLELLFDSGIDTSTSQQSGNIRSDTDDTSDTSDTSIDSSEAETPETLANTGDTTGINPDADSGIDTTSDASDTGTDTGSNTKRYTKANLTGEQVLILIRQLQPRMSQTQLIQDLWCVEKNKTGWKQAYTEFKELMGE
jgi:high-affinity Fe2+/Pb2+ permease